MKNRSVMTLSHWQRQETGPALECDVAIVGGGIIGVSTAYWLKKMRPRLQVAVVEAKTLGQGASGRNAGYLLQGAAVDYQTDIDKYGADTALQLWQFTQENRRLIESELDGSKIHLEANGSLILAGSDEENDRLKASASLIQKNGTEASYWSAEVIREKIKGTGFKGGLHISSGGGVNSMKLIREIAGQSGAVLLESHPVFDIQQKFDKQILATPRREVHAKQVIFCLNAYLPKLLPETSRHLRPIRAQMLATQPLAPWLTYPVYSHEGYYYVRQLDSGVVLMGGARHLFTEEEVGYTDQTTTHLQNALSVYLNSHFPHLERIEPAYEWSGIMCFTEDGLPLVGSVRGAAGSYWAAGFNGHGMGYGFRFGKMLAHKMLATGEDAENNQLFDVKRVGGV